MRLERRVLGSTIAGGVSFIAATAQAIVLVPVLLNYWGAERYGLWLGLFALYTLFRTLDTGHQVYIGNELCKYYSTEQDRFKRILASSLRMALLLGLLQVLATAGVIGLGVLERLMGTHTSESVSQQKLGWCLIVLVGTWVFNGSIGGVLVKLYAPAGRNSRDIWWAVILRLCFTLSLALTAVMGGGILAACIVSSLVVFLVNAGVMVDLYRLFRPYYPFWAGGTWTLGWTNASRSVVLTATGVIQQLQSNGVILAVSSILGAAMAPILATMRTLSNAFMQATTIITQPLVPEMIRYHFRAEHEKLGGTISGCWWSSGVLINIGLVGSLPFIEPLYSRWTRGQITFDWTLYLMLAWSVSLKNLGAPLLGYLLGINHLRAQSLITCVQSAIVLGGSALLLSRFGLLAAGSAIVIGEIVGSVLIPVWIASSELRRLGGRLPLLHMVLALASVVCVFIVFSGLLVGLLTPLAAACAGVLGLSALYAVQWTILPVEVKRRLVGLLRPAVSPWISH